MSTNKIKIARNVIEIRNNWIGVQTVLVNGRIVSKKFSFSGTDHYFTISEDEDIENYVLTTKASSNKQLLKSYEVLVDLRCNGKIIKENVLIDFNSNRKKENNENKTIGIKLLREHEIKNAIKALKRGLDLDINDPEIYFYLACCYSLEEKKKDGFECIKKAFENNFSDIEMILNHEMLAYLRIQDGFEEFLNSKFTKYDETIFEEE